jgi:hypothetical protein
MVTYYVLVFMQLGSRQVSIGGITDHPDALAMEQMARNATLEELGCLHPCRYLLPDRDTRLRIVSGGVEGRRSEAVEVSSEEPESERLRGEMGAVGKR